MSQSYVNLYIACEKTKHSKNNDGKVSLLFITLTAWNINKFISPMAVVITISAINKKVTACLTEYILRMYT